MPAQCAAVDTAEFAADCAADPATHATAIRTTFGAAQCPANVTTVLSPIIAADRRTYHAALRSTERSTDNSTDDSAFKTAQ
jgi:hypothetical protein